MYGLMCVCVHICICVSCAYLEGLGEGKGRRKERIVLGKLPDIRLRIVGGGQ